MTGWDWLFYVVVPVITLAATFTVWGHRRHAIWRALRHERMRLWWRELTQEERDAIAGRAVAPIIHAAVRLVLNTGDMLVVLTKQRVTPLTAGVVAQKFRDALGDGFSVVVVDNVERLVAITKDRRLMEGNDDDAP